MFRLPLGGPLIAGLTLLFLACGSTSSDGSSNAGTRDGLVQAGEAAPAFRALDQAGRERTLTEFAGKAVVLYFYPRDATPGCTREACAFRDRWTELGQQGAQVLGVSTDSVDSHRRFAEEHELPFPLLADTDQAMVRAYGVGTMFGMARRVTFIIDQRGVVRSVFPDVDPAVHADQVMEALAQLQLVNASRGHEDAAATRSNKAFERLKAAGEAGRWLRKALSFHGDLRGWYGAGPLHFRFRYEPLEEGASIRDSAQWIDIWSSRAVHTLTEDPTIQFGWDGSKAWFTAGARDKMAINPRFWSLTPYYFFAIPFVLVDDGISLSMDEDLRIEDRRYKQIRVTFGAGVGDSPDDYYLVLIDPESGRVGGTRYVVSYPGFFPDGGRSPEKLMLFDGERTLRTPAGVQIRLAEAMRSFQVDEGARQGKQLTRVAIDQVYFGSEEHPAPSFDAPDLAVSQDDWK